MLAVMRFAFVDCVLDHNQKVLRVPIDDRSFWNPPTMKVCLQELHEVPGDFFHEGVVHPSIGLQIRQILVRARFTGEHNLALSRRYRFEFNPAVPMFDHFNAPQPNGDYNRPR